MRAQLSYKIKEIRVLDTQYIVDEDMTSESLQNKIETEYPFKINIEKDDSELIQGTGDGKFTISVKQPYESGDDEKDTLWGNKAYEYYELNKDKKSIEIQLELEAKQITDNNQSVICVNEILTWKSAGFSEVVDKVSASLFIV